MILKQIKLSSQSRDKLARLKGKTGLQNWNSLCRWALCYSLNEPGIPFDIDQPADSNVEMSWHTFGGEYHELYAALIKARCKRDGLPTDNETLSKYFKLHLNRGISYLSSTNLVKSIDDLLALALHETTLEVNNTYESIP